MIGIMFWNTYRNSNIDEFIINAIIENKCDLLVLAEYPNNVEGLCNKISLFKRDFQEVNLLGCNRIKIICDKKIQFENIFDDYYYTIQNFKCFDRSFLTVALHFPSKMNAGDAELRPIVARMVQEIERAEKCCAHKNTIIIGDFNANPFESVCINADCFHAVPDIEIVKRNQRKVNFYQYQMFYNPMWNYFGDYRVPKGTYYNSNTGIQTFFWNIFDQVLLSAAMIKCFDRDSLKIITKIGNTELLNSRGIPDKDNISDHLPILFSIKEEYLNEQSMGGKF